MKEECSPPCRYGAEVVFPPYPAVQEEWFGKPFPYTQVINTKNTFPYFTFLIYSFFGGKKIIRFV